jgi:hypothetical protein
MMMGTRARAERSVANGDATAPIALEQSEANGLIY